MSERGYEEQLAIQLFKQGRMAEAEAAYRLALAKRPEDARLHLGLALCIDPEVRPDEALTIFRRAAELDNMLADAHNGVGICEPDLVRAEAAFRRALVLEPQTAEFHANLAVCLLRQDRPIDAEPCLRQAVTLEPSNLGFTCDWCELLLDLGRPRDVAVVLRKVLASLPDRRDLLDRRAWHLYEGQRYEEAEARLTSLRKPAKDDEGWLYYILARALRAQGQLGPAIDAVRTAIGLTMRVAEFHDELGRLLESTRQPDGAGAAYRRASELSR